jgi:tetratricopeptide (TPR) repeat protein
MWKKAVAYDPRLYDTLYNLGILLTQKNQFKEAIPYLERFVESAPPSRYGEDIVKVRRLLSRLQSVS